MATAKSAALALFSAACVEQDTTDWRAIAEQLAAALAPKPRAAAADDGFAPWCDKDPPGKAHPFRTVCVVFADGIEVNTSLMVPSNGKAPNIARACRVAAQFYRSRVRFRIGSPWVGGNYCGNPYSAQIRNWDPHISVPDIVAVSSDDAGLTWSPISANAATEECRAGSWSISETEREAFEAGMTPEDAAEWIRVSFEEAATADLVARHMIKGRDYSPSEQVLLDRAIRAGEVEPPYLVAQREAAAAARSNVIPFRQIAPRVAARLLSSVAMPDAIGGRAFAA